MSLKIIGGTFKGRSLKSPPTSQLSKPTTSLARKAVFDMCQSIIEESRFLDLFACSGAMGIEALSRGAAFATFVEKERKTAHVLRENLKLLQIENKASVVCQDVFKALPSLTGPYTIIYLDPPYSLIKDKKNSFLTLLRFLDESPLLAEEGVLFIEEGLPSSFEEQDLSLTRLKHKSTRRLSAATLHQLTF